MKKVLIRGPILTRTGYGEQARFAYRALKSRPDLFEVYIVPTPWGNTGWTIEDTDERKQIDAEIISTNKHVQHAQKIGVNPFDISIQVTIPQEWQQLAPVNIGFTAGTETTHISHKWVQAANSINRIIVVSEHTKAAFDNTVYTGKNQMGQDVSDSCRTPIDVVGFPVKNTQPAPITLETASDFNFLSVLQWSPRKNLENTIGWFLEEFKEDENVGLIVKANVARNSLIDRMHTESRLRSLKDSVGEHKCKVYLLHGNLSDEEMVGLYNQDNIHALINLAHGEGFGLPMFEAACQGLPVIAPNWSGQLDYMVTDVTTKSKRKKKTKAKFLGGKVDYGLAQIQPEAVWDDVLIAESSWCFPKEKSYKRTLREVYKNHTRFLGQARKLQTSINEKFSEENQNKKFVQSVLNSMETTSTAEQVITI